MPNRTQFNLAVLAVLVMQLAEPAAGATSTPVASKLTVELLSQRRPEGNVRVQVQFEDQRRGGAVKIAGGTGSLRDDGIAPDLQPQDGRFTAIVNLNVQLFNKEMQRRYAMSRQNGSIPNFDGREFKGFRPLKLPKPIELVPGVPVDITWFGGFWGVVDPERELAIRHLAVVEDPARTWEPCTGAGTSMGAWTFGRLVTEIANEPVTGIEPADLVEHWLAQWATDRTINGFTVIARPVGVQAFIDSWPKLPDGRVDVAQAPFRLLAIVNRQDLRSNFGYGGGGNSGEGRLVFGAVRCDLDIVNPANAMEFTVIFEYRAPGATCVGARSWAQQWRELNLLALGSAAYNTALQAITDQFTLRNTNPAQLPNFSSLNQLRTNEIDLQYGSFPAGWQLRESRLQAVGASAGLLENGTIAQTPDDSLDDTATLADYVNFNELPILAGLHDVPLNFPAGIPFRGGAVIAATGHWEAPGILNPVARHRFGLATCNGCHTTETETQFVHVQPRRVGVSSSLSDFLTGDDMPKQDPETGTNRNFNELLDRRDKLDATANMLCVFPGDFALDELFFEVREPALRH